MRLAKYVPAAALILAACSSTPESKLLTPSTPTSRAASIAIVSGNEQVGKAGERLAQPLVVRVTDVNGSSVRDVSVSFEISGAGGLNGKEAPGSIRAVSSTDANGTAQAVLEPYDIGPVSVTARVEGATLPPATFTATATSVVVDFRSPQSAGAYAGFYGPCRCARTMNAVTVRIGTPVEWASADSYTITATSIPEGGPAFDSGVLARGTRFRFVPTIAGTWTYRDNVSGLTATLTAN